MNFSLQREWKVRGWDTFAGEAYPLGSYFTEVGARRAAQKYLRKLAKEQPAEISGTIQDKVYIVRPDGSEFHLP